MNLKNYFENTRGTGILATSDGKGRVDAAIYARPHVLEDGSLAFVMANRLSHKNLKSNPKAAYLFIESGAGYQGKRFFMTKIAEEGDPRLIAKFRRHSSAAGSQKVSTGLPLRLVTFRVDRERPLVGES